MENSKSNTKKIAQLNDRFRTTLQGGQLMLTEGVSSQDETTVAQILRKVVQHKEFTQDNDPYGEHDFGSFTHAGQKYFWKIDLRFDLHHAITQPRRCLRDQSGAYRDAGK